MKLYYLDNREAAISRATEWAKRNPKRKQEINRKSNLKLHGVPIVQPCISEGLKGTVRCFFRDLEVSRTETERREVCLKYTDYSVFRTQTVPEEVEEQLVKYLEF